MYLECTMEIFFDYVGHYNTGYYIHNLDDDLKHFESLADLEEMYEVEYEVDA